MYYILCTTCGRRNAPPAGFQGELPARLDGWTCGYCQAATLIRVPEPAPIPTQGRDPRSSAVLLGFSGAAIGGTVGGPAGAIVGAAIGALLGAGIGATRRDGQP